MQRIDEIYASIDDAEDRELLTQALEAFNRAAAEHSLDEKTATLRRQQLAQIFRFQVSGALPVQLERSLGALRLKALVGVEDDPGLNAAYLAFIDTVSARRGIDEPARAYSESLAQVLRTVYEGLGVHGKALGQTISESWLGVNPILLETDVARIARDYRGDTDQIREYLARRIGYDQLIGQFFSHSVAEADLQGLALLAEHFGVPESVALGRERASEIHKVITAAAASAGISERDLAVTLDLVGLIDALTENDPKRLQDRLAEVARGTFKDGDRVRAFYEKVAELSGLSIAWNEREQVQDLCNIAFTAIEYCKASGRLKGNFSGAEAHDVAWSKGLIRAAAEETVAQRLEGDALVEHWAALGSRFKRYHGSWVAKREFGLAGIDAIARHLEISEAYKARLGELTADPPTVIRDIPEAQRKHAATMFRQAVSRALEHEVRLQERMARDGVPLHLRLDEEQVQNLRLKVTNCATSFDLALRGEIEHLENCRVPGQMRPSMERIKEEVASTLHMGRLARGRGASGARDAR